MTNGTNLINKPESLAPEVILVDKLQNNISVNSGLTGETRVSITPEKRIPKKKRNKKPLAMSPPR